jgi:hypothetical protein
MTIYDIFLALMVDHMAVYYPPETSHAAIKTDMQTHVSIITLDLLVENGEKKSAKNNENRN